MKRNLTKTSLGEVNSNQPQKNFETIEIKISSIDDNWSSDLLDTNDYNNTNNS